MPASYQIGVRAERPAALAGGAARIETGHALDRKVF
jgi:hypothetical protein